MAEGGIFCRKTHLPESFEKFQARRGVAPSPTWRTGRSSVARNQDRSNKRCDDSRSNLSIAVRRRENLGSLRFGVFQQNRPTADPRSSPKRTPNETSQRQLGRKCTAANGPQRAIIKSPQHAH